MSHKTTRRFFLVCLAALLAALHPAAAPPAPLALIHGRLIDGTGAAPIDDAMVVVMGDRIAAAGKYDQNAIPKDARRIDLGGAVILPGFFNAHVHDGFDLKNLETWAQAGVTTVCDLGMRGAGRIKELLALRDKARRQPQYARLLSGGPIITVPGGYGPFYVTSAADARVKVNGLIDAGVDLIKISMEDGYAGTTGLPKLNADEIRAIVKTAHARGKKVSAHITQTAYLQYLLDFGVDEFAHLPYDDYLQDRDLARIAADKIWITPTFSVYKAFGANNRTLIYNLKILNAAACKVALGSDFNGGPGVFEAGIPFYELQMMRLSGMTPMQIIVAGTSGAAAACGLGGELGSIAPGKLADLLVVKGDPLEDLDCLKDVRLVVHGGVIIRQ